MAGPGETRVRRLELRALAFAAVGAACSLALGECGCSVRFVCFRGPSSWSVSMSRPGVIGRASVGVHCVAKDGRAAEAL